MASRFSIEAVFRAIDQMTAPIKKMTLQNKKFVRGIKTDFAKAQRSLHKFGESFKKNITRGVKIGFGIAVAGMSLALKKGIELASDLVEVQNVVDATFGKSSDAINKWSKTAISAFGLSELQAKEMTGTLGSMIKSSGISGDMIEEMAINITGLAGDIASFRNLQPEEAFEKLQSIVTGTTKPLRQIGINMTVANLEAFALSKGIRKTWLQMSQAEQVTLRYNFVLAKTVDMQGDFNRTLDDSFANQKRVLQTKFMQILANSMKRLLPLLIKGAKVLNKMLDNIDQDELAKNVEAGAKAMIKFGKGVMVVFKILKPFIPFIIGAIVAWKTYRLVMFVAAAAQAVLNAVMTANPIGLIIVAVGALTVAIILLVKHWKTIIAFVSKWWDILKGLLIFFGPFTAMLVFIVEIIKSVVSNWDEITKAFKEGGVLAGIMAIGKAILSGILAPMQSFLELVSRIPGVGNLAKGGALKIAQLRESLFKSSDATSPIGPSERSSITREESVSRGELTIKDQTGRAEMTKNPTNKRMQLRLQSSGAF